MKCVCTMYIAYQLNLGYHSKFIIIIIIKKQEALTDLSHYLAQSYLLQVGGFATHVGACEDDEVAALRDVGVIGDRLLSANTLENGVAALLDSKSVSKLRTH